MRDGKGKRGGTKNCSILTESEVVGLKGSHVAGLGGLHHHLLVGLVPLAEPEEVAVTAEAQKALVVGTLGQLGGVQGLLQLLLVLGVVVDGPGDGGAGGHDDVVVGASGPLGAVALLGLGGGVGGSGGGKGGVTSLLLLQLAVNGAAKAEEVAVAVTSESAERRRALERD